jgi:hypothetical protein
MSVLSLPVSSQPNTMITSQEKTVLLTFGLLSPNKGFESVIQALPSILSRHKDVVYIIAGLLIRMSGSARGIDTDFNCRPWLQNWELGRAWSFTTGFSALWKWLRWSVRPTFTSRPTATRRRPCLEHSRMPWAPGRQSFRLRTGTLPNCWAMGAEPWSLLGTQPLSQPRQLNFWRTMRHAMQCANALSSMHEPWSGTG